MTAKSFQFIVMSPILVSAHWERTTMKSRIRLSLLGPITIGVLLISRCISNEQIAQNHVRRASSDLGSFQEPAKFGDQNIDVILKQK